MSGHPCFASRARLPDRSTPCRPASEASNRAVGPASNPFPSGLLPSGIGMAKPTIQQARDQAEVTVTKEEKLVDFEKAALVAVGR